MSNLFTFGQRLGIFLTFEALFLSGASVTSILCYALYRRLRRTLYAWKRKDVRWPSDATNSGLFLNLMVADLVQALGGMPNIKWMSLGAVVEGRLCTTQAVMKQIGIVAVSMTSLAIALHTFSILILRRKGPRHITTYAIISVWAFVALVIGSANLAHRNEAYYGNTGYWCWIRPKFKTEQIVTEYLWVWFSGICMIILYGIMFGVIRGWISISHGVRGYNHHRSASDTESDEDKKIKAIANSMLYYPAVYIVCVLPNSLARWLSFDGINPTYQIILYANAIFGLSGVFNLVLFSLTRPKFVVGSSPVVPNTKRRHEATWTSLLSSDIEKCGRPDSTLEIASPTRTTNRLRSFDLQGVSGSPTSRYPELHPLRTFPNRDLENFGYQASLANLNKPGPS